MPILAFDDVSAFLDEFTVDVQLITQKGDLSTFKGIFDDPYLNAQIGEYEADASNPRITTLEANLIGVNRGDTVTVDETVYDVLTTPQADGTGFAVITLAKQNGAF